MALKGETLMSGANWKCHDCGRLAVVSIEHSTAGYYIGSRCGCGPYTRESAGYWRTGEDASVALLYGDWEPR